MWLNYSSLICKGPQFDKKGVDNSNAGGMSGAHIYFLICYFYFFMFPSKWLTHIFADAVVDSIRQSELWLYWFNYMLCTWTPSFRSVNVNKKK